jgi:hypothetical protein
MCAGHLLGDLCGIFARQIRWLDPTALEVELAEELRSLALTLGIARLFQSSRPTGDPGATRAAAVVFGLDRVLSFCEGAERGSRKRLSGWRPRHGRWGLRARAGCNHEGGEEEIPHVSSDSVGDSTLCLGERQRYP